MPTSSQSKILSVVDHQLLQQSIAQDGTIQKSSDRTAGIETERRQSRDDRRGSTGRKDEEDKISPGPPNLNVRRRNSAKINDSMAVSRTAQRNDVLHLPVLNLHTDANIRPKTSDELSQYRRTSFNLDSDMDTEHQLRTHVTPMAHNSSASDLENSNDDDDDEEEENLNNGQQSSILNENARRLLVLGTIRPSRTFYRNLPASDVEHLMEYFHRMRNTNRKISSDEINQELQTKSNEYKPKMFYDSAIVTKSQVNIMEKLLEPYAEEIHAHQMELVKLDNPFRFVIKSMDNDTPLIIIPREYNDCFLTLISRSDPLRKSEFISGLVSERFVEDVKANSLDISYFPGGVNYDVPHDEIDENGQMKVDTYDKLKQRLKGRKIWYFSSPPEKKPYALIAILPSNLSTIIDHQHLLDCLYDRLKTSSTETNQHIEEKILSIEFLPLSCILDSYDVSNQFIIDCDTNETKEQLIIKPLKFNSNKQSITIELQSYDEHMRREYEKSVKAEKYRELIKNHDQAIKRTGTK